MTKDRRQAGFSLTETLLAVGTLAIGMTFIGGTFLTGVFFSTTSTERTVAAVAADEALAKIRLDGLDPNSSTLKPDGFVLYEPLAGVPADQTHLYPSTGLEPQKQYSWTALCRRASSDSRSRLVPCTVFISRQTAGATYWVRQDGANWPQLATADLPQPVRVTIVQDATLASTPEIVSLKDAVPGDGIDELAFVNDGALLVDDATGQIYRVLERYGSPPDKIRLDRPWAGGVISSSAGGWVWVVPPATSGGRNPVVAVYQDVLRFPGN
jgi:type II secretory pathway pseudopilin PulG